MKQTKGQFIASNLNKIQIRQYYQHEHIHFWIIDKLHCAVMGIMFDHSLALRVSWPSEDVFPSIWSLLPLWPSRARKVILLINNTMIYSSGKYTNSGHTPKYNSYMFFFLLYNIPIKSLSVAVHISRTCSPLGEKTAIKLKTQNITRAQRSGMW